MEQGTGFTHIVKTATKPEKIFITIVNKAYII